MPYKVTGAGSAQGAAIAAAPCTPGLWRTKSPLRGPSAYPLRLPGRARGNIPVKRPSAHIHVGCPGLQGTPRRFYATNTGAVFRFKAKTIFRSY